MVKLWTINMKAIFDFRTGRLHRICLSIREQLAWTGGTSLHTSSQGDTSQSSQKTVDYQSSERYKKIMMGMTKAIMHFPGCKFAIRKATGSWFIRIVLPSLLHLLRRAKSINEPRQSIHIRKPTQKIRVSAPSRSWRRRKRRKETQDSQVKSFGKHLNLKISRARVLVLVEWNQEARSVTGLGPGPQVGQGRSRQVLKKHDGGNQGTTLFAEVFKGIKNSKSAREFRL